MTHVRQDVFFTTKGKPSDLLWSDNTIIPSFPSKPQMIERFKFDFFRADRFGRSAPVQEKSGHCQFAPLKLRSLTVVPSSGAQSAPSNFTYGSSTARLFLPRQGAPVTDSRPFRAPTSRIKGNRSRSAVGCSRRCAPSTTASSPCLSVPFHPPVRNKRNRWNKNIGITRTSCSECSTCSIPLVERNNRVIIDQ